MGNYEREWHTVTLLHARCDTCGSQWESSNAHGVAVQHARRHKHYVSVERTIIYVYDHTPEGGLPKDA